MIAVEKPADEPLRKRSNSVQRMLDLEAKLKMQRKKAQPPKPKTRPILLTDPPPKPTPPASTTDREGSAADTDPRPRVSYSARARESMGTAAASYKSVAIARSTEAAATTCQAPDDAFHVPQDAEKEKGRSGRPRLSKVPPSASRTPHLFARSGPPPPPKDPSQPASFGAPPAPPKEGKLNKLRRRSGSMGSTSSVSITARIRSSLELPRGRSLSRDSFSSFMGGIKLRREKDEEDEWRAREAAAQKPPSYSIPARYMYRQPASSGLAGSLSRSASCSVASSGSLAAHFAPDVPATTFPPKRMSGPPIEAWAPPVVPGSDSISGDKSGGEVREGAPKESNQGPSGSQTAPGDGVNVARAVSCQGPSSDRRSPRASSVPSRRKTTSGECPASESHPTSPPGVDGKGYPPSASTPALAQLASVSGEQAGPQRRHRASLVGRLKGRRAGDSEDPQASDSPAQSSDERSRPPSSSRSFKDAAKAAFRRSLSRASSFRNRSDVSEASPAVSPTKDMARRIPEISGPLTSHPTTPDVSGPEYPDDWPLSDASSPDILPRPPPIVDPQAMRASDHSSVSSYETTRSHQRYSIVTPNTSRPESEMGIVSTAGAGDGQKALGGNEKPTLASPALLSAGVITRRTSTPPVRKKSSRRGLRTSAGSETSSSSNAPATPTMSHATATPTPVAANLKKATPESEARAQDDQSSNKLGSSETGGLAPLSSRSHTSPVDPAMLPKPLNLSQGLNANHSTDCIAPHKLRRQTKSRHLLNGEVVTNSPKSTEDFMASPDTLVDKQTPPVSGAEVARNGDVASPRMKSSHDEERKHSGGSKEEEKEEEEEEEVRPLERILVRCCSCGYFLDLPHRLYKQMIMGFEGSLESKENVSRGDDKPVSCPWCRHAMDVRCCAGFVVALHLKERLH